MGSRWGRFPFDSSHRNLHNRVTQLKAGNWAVPFFRLRRITGVRRNVLTLICQQAVAVAKTKVMGTVPI